MHNKIVQKCAPIIDGFSALNIFEVSYVEQVSVPLLKKSRALSKKMMTVTISTSSSSKKLISRSRQRLMMMSRVDPRVGPRVGRRSRERLSVMV